MNCHIFLIYLAVSSDERLIIAVTQHDLSYTSRRGEMSPLETITFVSESLKSVGHDIKEDQIVPVSGEWALTARMLKEDSSDDTLVEESQRALIDYRKRLARDQPRKSIVRDVERMDGSYRAMRDFQKCSFSSLESL